MLSLLGGDSSEAFSAETAEAETKRREAVDASMETTRKLDAKVQDLERKLSEGSKDTQTAHGKLNDTLNDHLVKSAGDVAKVRAEAQEALQAARSCQTFVDQAEAAARDRAAPRLPVRGIRLPGGGVSLSVCVLRLMRVRQSRVVYSVQRRVLPTEGLDRAWRLGCKWSRNVQPHDNPVTR